MPTDHGYRGGGLKYENYWPFPGYSQGTRQHLILFVMAGLVPAIHVFWDHNEEDVDARHKATSVRHGSCLKRRTALILLVSSWLRIIWTRKGSTPCGIRISFFMGF